VDDAAVRAVADAMVTSGMKKAGYLYVNIDDTWQGARDTKGMLQPNKKFPNMKALADYVHSKGLKIGIYSSPGPLTCAGYEGSFGHEAQDARTYAAWGIDYLKYDWCSAGRVYQDTDMQAVYQKMGDALQKTGRRIVYSLCQYGRQDVWKWGPAVGGNLWRTTGDISDNWASLVKIGFSQSDLSPYAKPGHWNDPDMLEVGNGGMKPEEYRTHLALWAILASPLLAGNDIATMTAETKAMLLNPAMIAVNQDPLGKQGKRVTKDGTNEVWTRHLKSGAMAIGVFNLDDKPVATSLTWLSLGLNGAPKRLIDIWTNKPVPGGDASQITTPVPPHGVAFWRLEP
jgi:alpha-galactosidase